MSVEPPALRRVGSRVRGRYECIDLLGSGAMGIVYRALDHELDAMQVAIKFIHPHLLSNERTVERFRNEVSLTRRLGHPNVVRNYEFGRTEEGQYFVVMEYVPGVTLGRLLADLPEGRLPLDHAIRTMCQIAAGLAHAHAHRLVHRDIKPDNVLVDPAGQVKICDFGVARALEEDSELTRTGASVGTPSYMAPEQFFGGEADERTDVYAVGLLAYKLVTGTLPFSDEVYFHLAQKHLNDPLPPLPKVLEVPEWYEELIHTCAAKDKQDRYASAGPVYELFRNHLDETTAERIDELAESWHEREQSRLKRRRKRRLLSLSRSLGYILFGMVLVLAIISIFLGRQWWLFGTYVLRAERIVGPAVVSPVKFLMGISASPDEESFREFLSALSEEEPSPDYREKTRNEYQLRMLIDAGADTNIRDASGEPMIMVLARRWHDSSVSLMLEKPNTDPNVSDPNGSRLIHVAVRNHSLRLLDKLFVSPRLDLNAVDSDGNSALHLAVVLRNPSAIERFLGRRTRGRTNCNLGNNAGFTPLHLALLDRTELLARVMKPLIGNSDPEIRAPGGKTALHLAVESANPAWVRLLLDAGANPLAQDDWGQTPLDLALDSREGAMIDAFVTAYGFDNVTADQLSALVTRLPAYVLPNR